MAPAQPNISRTQSPSIAISNRINPIRCCNNVTLLEKRKSLVTEPIPKTNHYSEYAFMTIPEIGSESPYFTRLLSPQKRDTCPFFAAVSAPRCLVCFAHHRSGNIPVSENG